MRTPPNTTKNAIALQVVLVSLDDYRALEETAYFLRSPKNAKRLIDSVLELEAGGGQERELIE